MVRVREAAATALVAAMLMVPVEARADSSSDSTSAPAWCCTSATTDQLTVGVGDFDFDHVQPAAEFRGEYRFGWGAWYIHPHIGVLTTTEGSLYAYAGIHFDLVFFDHYVLLPNASVGYYQKGGGKDLGSHTEFKTGAEFAYQFDNAWRAGVAFDHISNAGITRKNPGTENILATVSIPLPW